MKERKRVEQSSSWERRGTQEEGIGPWKQTCSTEKEKYQKPSKMVMNFWSCCQLFLTHWFFSGYLRFSSPTHQSRLWSGEQWQSLTGYILLCTTSKEKPDSNNIGKCAGCVIPGPVSPAAFTCSFVSVHAQICPLTIATSASRTSLIKWFRTRRSQIGLSGDGRPGRVHSNTTNTKASSPAHHRHTYTLRTSFSCQQVRSSREKKCVWDHPRLSVFTWTDMWNKEARHFSCSPCHAS